VTTARTPVSAPVDPLSLIIQPDEPVTVTRRADGDLVFRTAGAVPITALHAGTHPDAIDAMREISFTLEDGAAVVDHAACGLDPLTRYYFRVTLIDDRQITAAERYLPLKGAFNARDLGGYATADGRRVRWGRVFRTSHLGDLTPDDQAYLERIGIRLICDLRVPDEIAAKPDRPLRGAATFARPLLTEGSKIRQILTVLRYRNRLDQLLLRGYISNMIDQNAPVFGAIYRQMTDPANLPVILHCTAGKDRAGMVSALLLAALGVPEATIIADYSLSNRFFDHFKEAAGVQADKLRRLGVRIDALHPMLLAAPNTMRTALDYVRTRYGGAIRYLTDQAGMTEAEIEALRTHLLER
jgi:protein-tyrosine phosphatase